MDAHTPSPRLPRAIVESARAAADEHGRLEALTEREVLEAVRGQPIGRIGFVVDGWPVVLPVNFAVDGRDVVFRTDPGTKLDACRGQRVCFEVDGADSVYQRGWSALALGVAEWVQDDDVIEQLERTHVRPWASGAKRHWVRVAVEQWSGRRLARSWRYPMSPP
jgi:nitroimidazol reductase NimA-like FMN-containing flavoprotein (pyridoxamine 5'-phosphate oxidase superfamily)